MASGVVVSVEVVSVVDVSVVVVLVVVVTVSRGLMTKSCVPFFTTFAQRNCMAWRDSPSPRPATRGPLVATPARRGPEGAWDSVGWSQNPSVAWGFALETKTFAKRGQHWSTAHVPPETPPRTAKLHGTEGFSGRNRRRNWQGKRRGKGALGGSMAGKVEVDRRGDRMKP